MHIKDTEDKAGIQDVEANRGHQRTPKPPDSGATCAPCGRGLPSLLCDCDDGRANDAELHEAVAAGQGDVSLPAEERHGQGKQIA